MLGPAQALGLDGGIERGLGAVGPGEATQRGFEAGALAARSAGQHAAFTFNHDRARLATGGAHPFGPDARLAKAPPGADQPAVPFTGWR